MYCEVVWSVSSLLQLQNAWLYVHHFTFIEFDKLGHVGGHETHIRSIFLEHHVLQIPAAHTDTKGERIQTHREERWHSHTDSYRLQHTHTKVELFGYVHTAMIGFHFCCLRGRQLYTPTHRHTDSYQLARTAFTLRTELCSKNSWNRQLCEFSQRTYSK